MMDFSMRIMFALLLSSQQAGGDVSLSIERDEPSKSHHQLHQRQVKEENNKNVVQSATDSNSYLEWVRSAEVPKDAVTIEDDKTYYITRKENCELCFFYSKEPSCTVWLGQSVKGHTPITYNEIMFLVNRDNFEIMEWKKCTNQKIPPMSVEACNGYFIAKMNNGYRQITAESMKKLQTPEVLTLNTGFKMQHLNVFEYLISSVVTSENLEVLKHFQASNKNCKPAKHTVKLDQNIDKTISYQTGKNSGFGVNAELTVNGEILSILNVGGKLGFKYDRSHSHSNTTSVVETTLHSVGMEVEVPPNHSCSIDITSNTFKAEVPFTGEVTRTYNNNEIRKTFINGTYIHQEVAEIQTLVSPCQPLSGGRKCVSTQT